VIANQVWAREQWSTGIMDLEEYQNNFFLLVLPNTPVLQHSSIPRVWHKPGNGKNNASLISYRNYEI